MRKLFSFVKQIFLGLLLTIPIMSFAQSGYPENSPVALNGKLKVEYGKMVNECGYPTQLRGMSTHGLAWNKNTYNESSIKTLVEDWNISLFRIAVYTHEWGGYSTNQWKSKDEYHVLIDELVDLCEKYGIYCIIDWHVLNQGSGDPNYTLEDAKYFWEYMSKTHSGKNHVLYEICNEPNGNVDWDDVKEYANIIIPLIRENDPNTIIICGSPTWSQDVDIAAQSPLKYDNLMYTLHFYSGTHGSYLRSKAEVALKKGLAIFVTEFGTSRADGNGGVYTKECDVWFDWMEKNCISWANWSFCDKNETSAALKPGSADQQNWNNVSESGEYIKTKLLEENKFVACTDTTTHYEPDEIPNFDDGDLVEDYDNDVDLILYPNPSNGTFSIKTDLDIIRVVVYDVLGNQVADFNGSDEVYTTQLSKGIYYVKIYGADFVTIREIIIE